MGSNTEELQSLSFLQKAGELETQAALFESEGKHTQAMTMYKKALGIYKEADDQGRVVDTKIRIGKLYNKKGKLDLAIQELQMALDLINRYAPSSPKLADVFFSMAMVYEDLGLLEKAIQHWKLAVPFLEELKRYQLLAETKQNIGFAQQDLNNYQEAIKYLDLAFDYFNQSHKPLLAADTANAIGINYLILQNYSKAIEQFDLALTYYEKTDNQFDHMNTLISRSMAHKEAGSDSLALSSFLEALLLHEQDPTLTNDILNLRQSGEKLFNKEKIDHILNSYLEGVEMQIDSLAENTDVDHKLGLYQKAALLHNAKGEFSRAEEYYLQAVSEINSNTSMELSGHIYQDLGKLYYENSQLELALKYYKKAKDIFINTDNHEDEFYAIVGISKVHLSQGKAKDALIELKSGVDQFKFHSSPLIKSVLLNNLGHIYRFKGRLDEALEMYLQAMNLIENTSNPLQEALVLHYLGETYFLVENYKLAEIKYNKAMKLYKITPHYAQKARTLTGLGNIKRIQNKDKQALQHYISALEIFPKSSMEKAYPLNNIAEIYISMGKLDQAIECTLESLSLLQDSPNPFLKAIPLKRLGKIYYQLKEAEKAFEFCAQAVDIYKDSPNPDDIAKPLRIIKKYEPERANILALSTPLGCYWIISQFKQKIHDDEIIETYEWKNLNEAVCNIWHEVERKQDLGLLDSSIFKTNWKLNHMLEDVSSSIVSEFMLAFMFGANDITYLLDNEKSLRDTQPATSPLWFVEVPDKLKHGQQYLKIRLNNLIYRNGDYHSVPSLDGRKPSIERIVVSLETQWLQKKEIDHIFYPSNDQEYESYKEDKKTWISDIVVLDMGDHTKRITQVDLNFAIKIYFDEESSTPDVRSTTENIQIPVYRNKNFQKLEKYKEQHNNLLTVLLAVWSIIISASTFLLESNFSISSILSTTFWIILLISSTVLFLGLSYWMFRDINTDKLDNNIQEHSDKNLEYYRTTMSEEFENIGIEHADTPRLE